ncbi:mitochondrial ribosomal protein MRP51 [Biscogniauxia mediterranea]|nr:mitochondrial ribosomal protein MRP51 [Biscogniauxia mediterranea]
MSGATVSPGAALLRSSRMFSMPAPIPGPPGNFTTATKHHNSSATASFPTHLSVTTPSTSRIVGDWGFKRPLPLRTTTRSTYPLIRVKQVDSIEHVTDFVSSSDHTITLKKYQEMHLPISVPPQDNMDRHAVNVNPKSVFEEDGDVLALDQEKAIGLESKRWKFKGPWLAGMTDGDFNKYIEKTVRNKRPEFRAFLKRVLAAKLTKEQETAARDAAAETMPEPITAESITEQQFMDELKRLREERTELYTLVSRFLDLAPVSSEYALLGLGRMAPGQKRDVANGGPYSQTGPPMTHPSAGLSYLRTRSFQENHPIYGPQLNHAPVQARVLMPSNPSVGVFSPYLGLAGFVPETPYGDNVFNSRNMGNSRGNYKVLQQFELEKRGGGKMYVEPSWASPGPNGVINITVTEATQPMATLIVQEMKGEDGVKVYEENKKAIRIPEVPRYPQTQARSRTNYAQGGATNYGLGPSDFNKAL